MSAIADTIRYAKPAFHRRTWQLLHVLTGLLVALSLAAWLSPPQTDPEWMTPQEAYDPSLARIDTLDAVMAEARSKMRKPGQMEEIYQLEQVLRYRFYHGYTRYGLHENWAAWLAARVVHPDLDAIVDPDEIIRHGAAACSQQGIVVQAALERMGVKFATVELPNHFLSAAWIDGQWYMVDPWGPNKRDRSRLFRLEELMTIDGRKHLFPEAGSSAKWDKLRFEVPKLTKIDQFPAPRARQFHRITKLISDWLWLPFLSLMLARLVLRRPSIWPRVLGGKAIEPSASLPRLQS